MVHKKLFVGKEVAHALFPHWGVGVIEEARSKDNLGIPTTRRYKITWPGRMFRTADWFTARELKEPKK